MEEIANYNYVARSVELAATLGAETVIEIGCGDGRTLCAIQSNNPNIKLIGVDVSRETVICASEALTSFKDPEIAEGIALLDCHGNRVPIASNSADLVLLLHVLHHAGDLTLIREAARILRPGGILFVVDLSNRNPLVLILRLLWRFLPTNLRRRFDREYTVRDEAPPVRLVSPNQLNQFASSECLSLIMMEDDGLFAFIFTYILYALPPLRRPFALLILKTLRKMELAFVRRTPARHFAEGIARAWKLL